MLNYFDGDFRRRPQQSLGGTQREVPRQLLLKRTAQERRHREELRRQTNSATLIQSFIRGCLVRKREYSEIRKEFDEKFELLTKQNEIPSLNTIEYLIQRLIIFYSDKKDSKRLNWLSQQLIKQVNSIVNAIVNESNHWLYRMKCILHFNIRYLENTVSQQSSIAIPMRILELYTSADVYKNSKNANQILSSIWNYLISKGFFKQMRKLIDSKIPEPFESTTKAPTSLSATLLDLTLRPFKVVKHSNERITSYFIKNFLSDVLSGRFSPQIKNYVLTSISNEIPANLRADYIIDSLLPNYSCDSITICLPPNIWLLYSVLKLIGSQMSQMNHKYIVKYLHILRCLSLSLSELAKPQDSEFESDFDTEENEAMDTNDSVSRVSTFSDSSLIEEILLMINETIHVQHITSIIDTLNVNNDSETLISLSCLCHSLLTSHPLAVNQYRLLYTLAFKSEFLRVLWKYITSVSTPSVFGSPTSLLYILSRGLPLAAVKWHQILPQLTLFCALFSYLFRTLDDVEFYKDVDSEFNITANQSSTMPFTLQELASMGLTLRDVCIGLVELAYHDTRPPIREDYQNALISGQQNSDNTTDDQKNIMSHWNKLFKSCVKLLRQLYARDSRRQFCPPEHWISKQVSVPVERPTNFRIGVQQRRLYREFIGIRHLTREELEEHGPPLSTTEVRNVTILQEIPFVVSFHDRVKILQTLIYRDRSQQRGDPNTFNAMGHTIQIVIRRNYIYEDAFDKLSVENEPNLKQSLRVQLVSAIGLDEAGIDGGGIFREFLSEVLKTAFDPNRGFFRSTSDSLLYPNPSVTILLENYTKHYYFIGRMLGKAIYENMLVELPFAPFFLAKLLAKHSASDIEIHHLASLDREMYKNLIYLKNYEGDVSELGLDFTVINNDLGTHQVIELKPGGDKIPVTAHNRIEYIHLMADYRLNKQIRSHCSAFKQGLSDILDLDWLRMFDPRELQILISGAPTPIDIEDLRKHTNYSGGYSKDHIVIITFWKVVSEFDEQEKRKLLKFVTSCSRPPLLGFKDLFPPLCIQNAGREPNRLPTASTCMNLLKLPEFQDIQTMKQKLAYALDSGSGFELS